jgi:hypothetical protein
MAEQTAPAAAPAPGQLVDVWKCQQPAAGVSYTILDFEVIKGQRIIREVRIDTDHNAG